MGSARVMFFAGTRVAAGVETCDVEWAGEEVSVDEFWELLVGLHPGLAPFRGSVRLARNHGYLEAGECIRKGDEIALIPPVSGG